jgi:methyl-accepting chemotaxis protein
MKNYHNFKSAIKYLVLIITAIVAATFIATFGFNAMHTLPAPIAIILVILIDISIAIGLWMAMTNIMDKTYHKIKETADKIANGKDISLDIETDKADSIWYSFIEISNLISWYKGIIDAVPFPIHVTDNDMNWTYMNKSFEKLMIENGVIRQRKDGYGKACCNAGANICNTENCGIKQLLKGNSESYFDWYGMNCKQNTSYLKNKNGENIGFIEVITDLTSLIKVNSYRREAIEDLSKNLDILANGNLDVDFNIKEADKYTTEARENFVVISNHLSKLKDTLRYMTDDVQMLVSSAKAGKLDARADVKRHKGCFANLIEGINQTLEIIEKPLNEARKILAKITVNDYTQHMEGEYEGTFHDFAEAINQVRQRLLSIQDSVERIGRGDTSRLEEFQKIGKRSENDKMMVSISTAMLAIRELINQADILATATLNGHLDVRGDENKFEGGYKDIIKGMNNTMKAIAAPIEEASSVMQEMARGNLTVSMDGDYKGDYNNIKQSLNTTIVSFNNILNDISSAASQVASGSNQVSNSAQSLSQGSMEQASSIEELTASIEEISTQTKQNANHADDASKISLSAKNDAIHGNEQMHEMCRAMEDINESSTNISKIIKVIDDIAFQTNILALNAAVEAARAGQHGKGFAVVAEEVRTLAARSANAAKETTSLIEGSIQRVNAGTKIANDTAQALVEIVNGVEKATTLVGDIAQASNEQASGIEQINQGIMQVSKVTQMNSATSEESAAASQELFSQAEMLNSQVSRFTLRKTDYSDQNINGTNLSAYNTPVKEDQHYESAADTISRKQAAKNIVLDEFSKY